MSAKLTFTQEMRAKAMSLHTFSQAPKEGKKKDTKETQVVNWETTKEDFLQFLTDSLVVYEVTVERGRKIGKASGGGGGVGLRCIRGDCDNPILSNP